MKLSNNMFAFLQLVREIVGTQWNKHQYNSVEGNKYFNGKDFPKLEDENLLCGAYYFASDEWDVLAQKLKLKDFTAENQDMAMVELLKQNNAIKAVENGDVVTALYNLRKLYPQHLPKTKTKGNDAIILSDWCKRFERLGGELKKENQ